ncbi:hypothetical protein [Tomitella cavernea]|uniref:Uncharacterized protein n=1 Tax=Tomitella cavernea TaxID=1387982 RepID=A0ABP9D152_9ACTN|nr:hypothetical protein [Tomitella cavernea]
MEIFSSLEEMADPLGGLVGSMSPSLAVGKGISGSMDLVLAINALPEVFS